MSLVYMPVPAVRHSPAAPAMLFLVTTALGAETREAEGANTAAAISAGSVVRRKANEQIS